MSLEMTNYGAEFKLDVGLYQLYQQAACQRIDNNLYLQRLETAWLL